MRGHIRGAAGRGAGEDGFTLVELLVVMLILAILSALAIPAFFSQREKARDADAKSALTVAQIALETYSTDHDGSYAGAATGDLTAIEPTLSGVPLTIGATAARTYEIELTSLDGQTFRVERAATGAILRTCSPAGSGGCPSDGVF